MELKATPLTSYLAGMVMALPAILPESPDTNAILSRLGFGFTIVGFILLWMFFVVGEENIKFEYIWFRFVGDISPAFIRGLFMLAGIATIWGTHEYLLQKI